MSTDAATSPARLTPLEQLRSARQVIQMESRALAQVAKRLDGVLPGRDLSTSAGAT